MKSTNKPQAGGRPRRNPKAAATSTFSIRMTPEERWWVEEAAVLRNEPAASLARQGAVDRAMDFLNFSGAEDELRPLAERLASRIVSDLSETDTHILLDVLQTATVPFVEMIVEILHASMAKERGYTPLADRRGQTPESRNKKTSAPVRKHTGGK